MMKEMRTDRTAMASVMKLARASCHEELEV